MSSLNGKAFEDYVANNLPKLFPNLSLVNRHEQIANQVFDIHAKNSNGVDYFIEIKNSKCNRLNIGQIVEYKASLTKANPRAKIILVCKNADEPLKEVLKNLGVDIRTFVDLGIPEDMFSNRDVKIGILKLSPIEQNAYFALLKRGLVITRAKDLSSVLDVSFSRAKNILSKLAKRGALQRVGRGKYLVIPADILYKRKSYVGDPLVLVSELMKDTEHYVAYYSAAHVHGLTEQMTFKTTVAVLKQMRPINVGNISLNFVNLKKSRFFGYEEIRYLDATLNVSDVEKTLVDSVDRPDLCGGIPEVFRIISNAFETGQVNQQKLVSYVEKFQNHAVAQRLGFILNYLEEREKIQIDPELLKDLQQLSGSKVYFLDTQASKKGELSKKWKINNNAGYIEL